MNHSVLSCVICFKIFLFRDENYQVGSRYWGEDTSGRRDSKRASRQDDESWKDRRDRRREDRHSDEELRRKASERDASDKKDDPKKATKEIDPVLTRTGGAYIPPAKLRMMQAQITDKSSMAYQRLAWEALKKSIHGLINKINVGNIPSIIPSLLKENIVRGRGLLTRSIMQAQAASPTFTHVYAALVSVINSKVLRLIKLFMPFV